jgi:hypothetical protein
MLKRLSLPGGLRLWITLLTLAFVGVALISHASGLRALTITRQGWWWLVFGLGLSWLSLVVNAVAWKVLIHWLGHQPERLALIPLYLRSNLLKYLPGGIWHFLERFRALRPELGGGKALVSVLLEPMVMAVAALLCVPFGGVQDGLALLSVLPAALLIPRWREPLLHRLETSKLRQLNRVDPGSTATIDEGELGSGRASYPWWPLISELLFVLCRFAGFWCCLQTFGLGAVQPLGLWLAAFSLAWTAGLVVPAAPGGLGVFESVILIRMNTLAPEAQLLAVALSYRLLVTLSDCLAAGSIAADARVKNRFQWRVI